MGKSMLEFQKSGAMIKEVEASFNFIIVALEVLKNQNSIISNNHVSLQLFASGFERIMKILLLIKEKHLNGKFPELSKAKPYFHDYDNGHGIKKMLDELISYSDKVESFEKIPMLIEDFNFLKNNNKFTRFIEIITKFSIQQRYYYIDTLLLGKENNSSNPFEEFKELIWSFEENIDIINQTYKEEERVKISNTIICIERGTRAISRFFTHGFGDLGKMYYSDFSNFILLKDKDLGKLDYTRKKSYLSEIYQPISNITLKALFIKWNSRSKILNSTKYEDWAFKTDHVIVYSYKNKYFFVKIDNKLFALTGKTSGRFKVPTYFESKKLIPRRYATYLLEEAKKLH